MTTKNGIVANTDQKRHNVNEALGMHTVTTQGELLPPTPPHPVNYRLFPMIKLF